MSRTAKRLRTLVLALLAIIATNAAIATAFNEKSGIPMIPDVPRPKSGIPMIPDVPRP
jgi:hypothetical protein